MRPVKFIKRREKITADFTSYAGGNIKITAPRGLTARKIRLLCFKYIGKK